MSIFAYYIITKLTIMDIRDNIKRVIKQHGMTSREIADAKGVTKSAFAQTIANNPTVNTLQEIADIIGCDIAEFFQQQEKEDTNTITCPCCGAKLRITPQE